MTTPRNGAWESTGGYVRHDVSEFDNPNCFMSIVRAESMDLVNDPRFFTGNVIDKRLGALGKITVVSSLMLGTAFGQMFAFPKNMDFSEFEFGWLPVGWIQIISFCMMMIVSFICMTTVYVLVHQTFYTYRLMTSGPHGFEEASMFYLNRSICKWRRFAVVSVFNGMILYILATGLMVFVKFFKDAKSKNGGPTTYEALNPPLGSPTLPPHEPKLDIYVHTELGAVLGGCFIVFGFFLLHLHNLHLAAFRTHYHFSYAQTNSIVETRQFMASRAGTDIET